MKKNCVSTKNSDFKNRKKKLNKTWKIKNDTRRTVPYRLNCNWSCVRLHKKYYTIEIICIYLSTLSSRNCDRIRSHIAHLYYLCTIVCRYKIVRNFWIHLDESVVLLYERQRDRMLRAASVFLFFFLSLYFGCISLCIGFNWKSNGTPANSTNIYTQTIIIIKQQTLMLNRFEHL